jgi:hypothetical protein
VCVCLDRAEVLLGPGGGVEQVQSAGAGAVVVVAAGLREHGERAAVGSLPQLGDVPVAEHVRGGDPAGAQVEQTQPGTRLALTDDDGVVAVPGAARVLLGGFVLGEQSDQVGFGERKVVDDAGAPVGHRGRRAVGEGEAVHLRGAAVGSVGQEEERARVSGPAWSGFRRGVGRRPARPSFSAGVDEPELGVEVVAGSAAGCEDVAEQLPVRGKGRGFWRATIDHELGGQLSRVRVCGAHPRRAWVICRVVCAAMRGLTAA